MSRRLGLFVGALLFVAAGLSCVYVKELNLIRLGDQPTSRPAQRTTTAPADYPQTVDEVLEQFYE